MKIRISIVFQCDEYELIAMGSIICGTRLIVTMGDCVGFSIVFDFFDFDRLARRRPLLLLDRCLPLRDRPLRLDLLFY